MGSSFPQCNSSQEGWRWDPRGTSLGNSCPSSSADLSEAKHPVKTSSWAWQAKGSFMMRHAGRVQKVIWVRQWVPGGLGGGLAAWSAQA